MSFTDERLTNEQLDKVSGGTAHRHTNNSYWFDPPYYLIVSPYNPGCPYFSSDTEEEPDIVCGNCTWYQSTVEVDLCKKRTEEDDPFA